MRSAWLVLCACALSLVRADRDTPTPADRVTPMPADPELNAKWLEDFRRELLRDAYDDDTSATPPGTLVYRTGVRETISGSTQRPHASGKVPLPALRTLGAVSTRRAKGRTPSRHLSARHSSGEPDPPPDASVRHRTGSAKVPVGHMPGRLPPDAPGGPLLGRLSGRPPARHSPDDASVGYMSGRPPARSPHDAASRELGISRRDLYGGRGLGSMTDQELDAKRQPFLKSMHELDDQMMPVVIRHDANSDNRLGRTRKSRKGLWHANSEQIQDKPSYIIDHNGIKRYRVHTDPRERFRNQFGAEEPGFKEEWGFNEFDEMRGLGEDRYQGGQREARYQEGLREGRYQEGLREARYQERLREDRYQERGDENLGHNDDRYQESRDDSSSTDEGVSISDSHELNVSEYQQETVRSRYIQEEQPKREYGQRFSARRDAALLADGLASSRKPCNCMTEHPDLIPQL